MLNFITNIDKCILRFIDTYIQNPFLDKIMPFISRLGNHGCIWIVICLIFILTKKYRKAGILGLYSLAISVILVEVLLKNIIARPRPFIEMPDIKLLIPKPTTYSFPSGHTSSSFAAAAAFTKLIYDRKIIIPLFLLACLISFSRVYLMVHYPTDIVGGIVVGLLSAELAYMFFINRDRKI